MNPEQFQVAQASTAQGILLLLRRQWDRMDSLDDWPSIANRVTLLTAAGQKASAERAVAWTADQLDVASDVDVTPLVGVASDGRPLETMLYSSVARARQKHEEREEQVRYGRTLLSSLAHTAIADAGRVAAGVMITATPRAGYVRQVRPPCCQRCAVLAGKFESWSTAFQRHPQCDCVNVPAYGPEGGQSIELDDIRDLTAAQRQAIEDGADMAQVINSHRGTASKMFTTEGVTKRGEYVKAWQDYVRLKGWQGRYYLPEVPLVKGKRIPLAPDRPTPERIYKLANGNRQYALAYLARYGYIRRGTPLYERALRIET